MSLLKNTYFWITTSIFLVVGVGTIWLAYPPLLSAFQDNRSQISELNTQIDQQQQHLNILNQLNGKKDAVASLYSSANIALPTTTDPEDLVLQLRGMLNSIGLTGATITAPFQSAAAASSASSATNANGAQPITQTGTVSSAPIVNGSAGAAITFTLTGTMDYPTTQTLLAKLKTFARWNKVTTITITSTSGAPTTSVTAQIFSKAAGSTEFTGSDPAFLDKTTKLFAAVQSYAVTPDATKQGTYGRVNPFATP